MNMTATEWTDFNSDARIRAKRQTDGSVLFACYNRLGEVLNKDGQWVDEPFPSNRDPGFMGRCRFAAFEDAYAAVSRALELPR